MTEKPECVGCGLCCIQQRCSLSVLVLGGKLSLDCPALMWDECINRYRCILILMVPSAYEYFEIGKGCLAPSNWRSDVRPRTKADVKHVIRYHIPSPQFMDLLRRTGVI